jgi:hypothetical protein
MRASALLSCVVGSCVALSACGGGDPPGEEEPPPVDAAELGPATADVVSVSVTGPSGAAAKKGAPLHVAITVENRGRAGSVRLSPAVTSARFADFTGVPLGTVELALAPAAMTTATLEVGSFLSDAGGRYALGRGDYRIDAIGVALDGAAATTDEDFTGAAFTIAPSNAIFAATLYDQAYFTAIGWTDTPDAYMRSAFTRASELYDGTTYQAHAGGFDQMMDVDQQFLVVPGLAASNGAGGFCEQVGAYARTALGLTRDWDADESQPSHTDVAHHGFDYLIGLTPAMGGGAACGWLGVQVSGVFNFDLSLERSQIILVHESGHIFGAPHCDPMQGYVMCAGEQHAHYRDDKIFVWHQASRDVMRNLWP